jgi:hypothetical protein
MLCYYNEVKNDIMEVLENSQEAKNILWSENCKDAIIENLVDFLIDCDDVTGNGSGSYYFNSKKARQQCYNYASDVKEALEVFGYEKELAEFKFFEALADEGCINVDTMKIDDDALIGLYIIDDLDFESLDVITRCYKLYTVVTDVVEIFLRYGLTQ